MNWETLLSFGDSITFGARSYLGYPEITGALLGQKLDKQWHVINHSTNGFTTIDLVRSINTEYSNYKSTYPSLITIMIGTNDIKNKIQTNDFRIAYEQLIIKTKLLSVNNNIILFTIPPLTQKVFYPYHYAMNEKIVEFNEIIKQLGNKYKVRVFSFNFNDDDFFDGVHLNDEGCRSVAKQLVDYILKDKGFESSSDLS